MTYWLSNDMKIIDFGRLGWPWRLLTASTVGYPSDSWASCIAGVCMHCDKTKTMFCDTVRCLGGCQLLLTYFFSLQICDSLVGYDPAYCQSPRRFWRQWHSDHVRTIHDF